MAIAMGKWRYQHFISLRPLWSQCGRRHKAGILYQFTSIAYHTISICHFVFTFFDFVSIPHGVSMNFPLAIPQWSFLVSHKLFPRFFRFIGIVKTEAILTLVQFDSAFLLCSYKQRETKIEPPHKHAHADLFFFSQFSIYESLRVFTARVRSICFPNSFHAPVGLSITNNLRFDYLHNHAWELPNYLLTVRKVLSENQTSGDKMVILDESIIIA